MKNIQATIYLLLASTFVIASAQAHEPSEHMKKSEKPKCEAMENMDHSKMDANDPIMKAMMKKCMSKTSPGSHHEEGKKKSPEGESKATKTEMHDDGSNH